MREKRISPRIRLSYVQLWVRYKESRRQTTFNQHFYVSEREP